MDKNRLRAPLLERNIFHQLHRALSANRDDDVPKRLRQETGFGVREVVLGPCISITAAD